MRIYAPYVSRRIIYAYTHNISITAIVCAECADAHNAQQRTCAYAHYAPLRIVCAEYASAHNIRGEGQRNTPLIFAHSVFSIPWSLFLFRGRRQLPQAGEVRRPPGPAWVRCVVDVVG